MGWPWALVVLTVIWDGIVAGIEAEAPENAVSVAVPVKVFAGFSVTLAW